MNENPTPNQTAEEAPAWQALDALQRRVLGVLVEKAKTTPDAYPLTVNAIKTACNQKSNRDPKMDLDADDVMATLDELREMQAVTELQGDGRVSKYRHKAYQWLGVDKVELAVLAELLLRGHQTVGELRGRAARMEPISGMSELRPILDSLLAKNLLVEITAAGRGQIVTHNLYSEGAPKQAEAAATSSPAPAGAAPQPSPVAPASSSSNEMLELKRLVESLTETVAKLEARVANLESN